MSCSSVNLPERHHNQFIITMMLLRMNNLIKACHILCYSACFSYISEKMQRIYNFSTEMAIRLHWIILNSFQSGKLRKKIANTLKIR